MSLICFVVCFIHNFRYSSTFAPFSCQVAIQMVSQLLLAANPVFAKARQMGPAGSDVCYAVACLCTALGVDSEGSAWVSQGSPAALEITKLAVRR